MLDAEGQHKKKRRFVQKVVTFNDHAISIETLSLALWPPLASSKKSIDPVPALERRRQSSGNPFRLLMESRFNRYNPSEAFGESPRLQKVQPPPESMYFCPTSF